MPLSNFYMKAPANLGLKTGYEQYGGNSTAAKDGVLYDGNYKAAFACGAPTVSQPFRELGDVTTKIVRQPVQQDMRYRQALAPGARYNYPDAPQYTALHGTAILFDETEPRDLRANIGEWIRSYATIPPTLERPESFKFPYQYYKLAVSEGVESFAGLGTYSKQVTSKVRRDYFLLSNMASFPLYQKPEIVQFDTNIYRKVGDGDLRPSPSGGLWFVSDDADFIAEDSLYELWHYPIYCRKTRYVPPPTDALFGEAFTYTPPA